MDIVKLVEGYGKRFFLSVLKIIEWYF